MANDEVSLDDILALQQKMTAAAMELVDVDNGDFIVKKSKELEAMGKELEALAKRFEAQELAKLPPSQLGYVEVQLTPDQRQRVLDETGLEMEFIRIQSDGPFMGEFMPHATPDFVERAALEEARRIVAEREGRVEAKAQFKEVMSELESQDNPDLQKQLKKLKDDPDFVGKALLDDD